MTRILVAGYQHETNTFAPSLADWAAFERGDSFPAFSRGQAVLDTFRGVNAPVGGFLDAARHHGWTLLPSAWAGATPSSYVTEDAFERIAAAIVDDTRAALERGLDAIYLDLHGAAVAQHVDDTEGELLERLRAVVGPKLPIVASLDLHANVTDRMLALANALVAYRSYPHVDMAATGERAATLLAARLKSGQRAPCAARRLPFLIPLPSQSTWMDPARGAYEALDVLDRELGTTASFCMAFPAADFDECAPRLWALGERADAAADALLREVARPAPWALQILEARDAVAQALARAQNAAKPVVVADTQDNPGASACLEVEGVLVAVVSGKAQLLDREMLRMLGVQPEAMRVIVVKSSNHFRADFTPIAEQVLVAKSPGPMAADPADLPWRKLPVAMRARLAAS